MPACIARRGSKRYNSLIDRLVLDFESIEQHTDEHPDPWHEQHETDLASAILTYEKKSGFIVDTVGLVEHDMISWLAASPHGLVGDDGCIHIRVRTSLRSLKAGRDKMTRAEQARYQATMFVCEREWIDVVDWLDGGTLVPDAAQRQRLTFDYRWFSDTVMANIVFVWRDVQNRLRARKQTGMIEAGSGGRC